MSLEFSCKNSGTGNALRCHVTETHSIIANKQAVLKVYFMRQSSTLVAWINDGRPSFPLLLKLRLLVVFGEGIWGRSQWNSSIYFFCRSCKTRPTAGCPAVDSFLFLPFNGILYNFKGFQLVSISVCLWFQRRSLYSGPYQVFAAPLVSRHFQNGGTGTRFGGRSFIYCFVERVEGLRSLFTATELSSCDASFETTENLETCTFFRWLWICCVVFVCLCFARLNIIRNLSRCWKIAKIFVKMNTEFWKLLVK